MTATVWPFVPGVAFRIEGAARGASARVRRDGRRQPALRHDTFIA